MARRNAKPFRAYLKKGSDPLILGGLTPFSDRHLILAERIADTVVTHDINGRAVPGARGGADYSAAA